MKNKMYKEFKLLINNDWIIIDQQQQCNSIHRLPLRLHEMILNKQTHLTDI